MLYELQSYYILTGFHEIYWQTQKLKQEGAQIALWSQKHNMFLFRKESKLKFQITPHRKLSAA